MGLILLLIILVLLFGGGLSGSPLPLFRRGPRHDIGDRYYSPSSEGLTRPLAGRKRVDHPTRLRLTRPVVHDIEAIRAKARREKGWIMDAYLLRKSGER